MSLSSEKVSLREREIRSVTGLTPVQREKRCIGNAVKNESCSNDVDVLAPDWISYEELEELLVNSGSYASSFRSSLQNIFIFSF